MTSSQDAKMLWNQSPEAMIAEWAKSFDYPIPGPSNLVAAISGGTPPAPELSLPQQLEQLASLFPESAFPISSPEDFVRKWQKWGMGNPQGFAGIQSLSNMPQIGFSLRHRDDEAPDSLAPEFGAPMDSQPKHGVLTDVPMLDEVLRPERDKLRRLLGPLGDIILDIAEQLTFPLLDSDALGQQFVPEEEIILDSLAYPLREIAARLPESLFPLTSMDDLVEKIEQGEVREVRPEFLWSLLDGVRELGVRFRGSESCQGRGAEDFPMTFGGPEDPPMPEGSPPRWWNKGSACREGAERLGPLGEIILDLADHIHFPVSNVSELAENFSNEDVLHLGVYQCRLKRIFLRVPDLIFPLESQEDLIEKLISLDFGLLTVERLHELLREELTFAGTSP